LIVLKYL